MLYSVSLLSSMSSMPSLNLTPVMTFAGWRKLWNRGQDFSAHRPQKSTTSGFQCFTLAMRQGGQSRMEKVKRTLTNA